MLLKLLLSLLLIVVVGCQLFKKGKMVGTLDKFGETCPGKEKLVKGYMTNVQIYKSDIIRLDYDINITAPFPAQMTSTWYLERCASKEAPDTCVKFQTVKTSQSCRILGSDDNMSSFYTCVHPRWLCPFKKMVYVGKNCSYDPSGFSLFPLGNNYWKFKVEMSHPKTKALLMCYVFEGSSSIKY